MENAYAQALLRLLSKGVSPTDAVASVRKSLERTGRIMLIPKIGRAFAQAAERAREKSRMTVSVAHAGDRDVAEKEIRAVLSELSVSAKDLVTIVDESLIGGWRLEGREVLVDASFKKQLLTLYNRTTQ